MNYTNKDHIDNLAKIAVLKETTANDIEFNLELADEGNVIENLSPIEIMIKESPEYKNAKDFYTSTAQRSNELLDKIGLLDLAPEIDRQFKTVLDLDALNLGSERSFKQVEKLIDKKIENLLTAIDFDTVGLTSKTDLHPVTELAATRKIQSDLKKYQFLEHFVAALETVKDILLTPNITPELEAKKLKPFTTANWEMMLSKTSPIPNIERISNIQQIPATELKTASKKMFNELKSTGSWDNFQFYRKIIRNNELAIENKLAANTRIMKVANDIYQSTLNKDNKQAVQSLNTLISDLLTIDKKYFQSTSVKTSFNEKQIKLPLADSTKITQEQASDILMNARSLALVIHHNDKYTEQKFGSMSTIKNMLIDSMQQVAPKLESQTLEKPIQQVKVPSVPSAKHKVQQSFDF